VSLQIKSARLSAQGASRMGATSGGLLSSIGHFVGTIAKGAIGLATGGPGGAISAVTGSLTGGGGGGGFPVPTNVPALPTPGVKGTVQRFLPGGQSGYVSAAEPKGHHLNKTAYFLKDGTFVPEGSRYVKNRRRNPLNPRALRHAVSRIDAGKIWQSKLHEISTAKYTAAGTRK
jgi:hypothetical protein